MAVASPWKRGDGARPVMGALVFVDRIHVDAAPVLTYLRMEVGGPCWNAWPGVALSATQWRPQGSPDVAPPPSKVTRRPA